MWTDDTMVQKPDTIRDLGAVDVTPFLSTLAQFTERFWELENRRKENTFSVFHHTEHIVFRFVSDHDDLSTYYDRPSWLVLREQLLPALLGIVEPYGLEVPQFSKLMLARLAPGHQIDRHVDAARGNLFSHKIHVPLQTDPSVEFLVDQDSFHLEVGRAYEVNNTRPHGAINPSTQPRIHFILEVFDEAPLQRVGTKH